MKQGLHGQGCTQIGMYLHWDRLALVACSKVDLCFMLAVSAKTSLLSTGLLTRGVVVCRSAPATMATRSSSTSETARLVEITI